jgi:hypothetical protein
MPVSYGKRFDGSSREHIGIPTKSVGLLEQTGN